MFEPFKQAERLPTDGAVRVTVERDGWRIECTTDGKTESLYASGYNAARIFAMLSLMLGIKLPNKIGESISM